MILREFVTIRLLHLNLLLINIETANKKHLFVKVCDPLFTVDSLSTRTGTVLDCVRVAWVFRAQNAAVFEISFLHPEK